MTATENYLTLSLAENATEAANAKNILLETTDALGVRFMIQAGYNPEALVGVMEILAEASGGSSGSDFMRSHPAPENRIEKIREVIARERK